MRFDKALLELLPALPLCGALVLPLGGYIVSVLSKRLGEPADPRSAGAWAATVLAAAVSLFALAALLMERSSGAFFLFLAVPLPGEWGLVLDALSGPALALAALLSLAALVATFARARGEAISHGALLAVLGFVVAVILARDLVQLALSLQLMVLACAVALLFGRERGECRRAALRYFLCAEAGAAIILAVAIRLAQLSPTTEIADLKQSLPLGDWPALRRLAQWLFWGWLLVAIAPTVPQAVPEVLSRRPLPVALMVCGASFVGAGYAFVRLAYQGFPYRFWAMLSGRMSWAAAALALGGTLAALFARAPSRRASYTMLAQVGLVCMALSADPREGPAPAVTVGLALVFICAVARAGMLVAGAAGRATSSEQPGPVHRAAHWLALVIIALSLFGASALTIIPLSGGRLAGPLLVVPLTSAVAWLWFSYTWTERPRRERLYLVLLCCCAGLLALFFAAPGPLRRLLGDAVDLLGVEEVFHFLLR